MTHDDSQLELLRLILENMLQPRRLDAHPWAKSLLVVQARIDVPDLLMKSPGQQLAAAIAKAFRQMMPATPPRQGKRLDTRWGEFGLLAAQYFSPFLFGQPSPESLRDAWGCIDKSISLFVFGPSGAAHDSEAVLYQLVGKEPAVAPNSTLSDWNRNGLRRLMALIAAQESHLAGVLARPAVIDSESLPEPGASGGPKRKIRWRWAVGIPAIVLFLLLLGATAYAGVKGGQIYQTAQVVRQDAASLQAVVKGSGAPLDRVKLAGPAFSKLKQDYASLRTQAEPWLWVTPWLKWVPNYGEDIAAVPQLMALADPLLNSVEGTYQALSPLLEVETSKGLSPVDLTAALVKAQPQLAEAGQQLNQAAAARKNLSLAGLSPEIQNLISGDVDPILSLMQDGLTFTEEFPILMGASEEGPKTYLLLAENEDELRPTGGFITAVGTTLIQDGKIAHMAFENSGDLEDWTKPYPAAPWQLQQYMNSRVLVLRDANWYTNFPTAALYAESLYAYKDPHSEDGVIAFDQQALVDLLQVTGPVNLPGVSYPIDAGNVVAYMRTAKIPTANDLASGDWNYKLFMQKIADALVGKIYSGTLPLDPLLNVVLKMLNEHHVLIQLDHPYMTTLLAKYHWDGAIRSEKGDFLMVVDSNVGFNKTNAVVKSSLDYDIDLTTPASPTGSLTVLHENDSPEMICKQWNKIRLAGEDRYPISDCYWNYLRVYLPVGAKLLDSTTQDVPAAWLIEQKDVPAHVDTLDEGIKNIQAFGTLQVVPAGESLTTHLRFNLPGAVLEQSGPNQFEYALHIRKQPGTKAVPLTLRVHLPANAHIQNTPAGAVVENNSILIKTDLQIDRDIDIRFSIP